MLRVRIATALILIPMVIGAVWFLPSWSLALIVACVFMLGGYEWAQFVPANSAQRGVLLGGLLLALVLTAPHALGLQFAEVVMVGALVWWLAAALWLALYPRGFSPGQPGKLARSLIGLLILVPSSVAIWSVHDLAQGRELVLILLALVWATDTGGYFVGRRFGRTKLSPQVSPNKTWEGAVGGLLFAAVVAGLGGLVLGYSGSRLTAFVAVGTAVAAVSIVGDLTISMFKRQCGVKDTGTLFPGHGGVLDRLDSLFAAAPALMLGMSLLPST